MTAHNQAVYAALRAYLEQLLVRPRDRQLASVPDLLRADLETFLLGKTLYHDSADEPVVYGHDLQAWAYRIIHLTGLSYPISLSDVREPELTHLRELSAD